jgi:hypothetical protein
MRRQNSPGNSNISQSHSTSTKGHSYAFHILLKISLGIPLKRNRVHIVIHQCPSIASRKQFSQMHTCCRRNGASATACVKQSRFCIPSWTCLCISSWICLCLSSRSRSSSSLSPSSQLFAISTSIPFYSPRSESLDSEGGSIVNLLLPCKPCAVSGCPSIDVNFCRLGLVLVRLNNWRMYFCWH